MERYKEAHQEFENGLAISKTSKILAEASTEAIVAYYSK
jgi:hypothetical protein